MATRVPAKHLTVDEVLAEFASHETPEENASNRRYEKGLRTDLSHVRDVAEQLGTHHDLAQELWATGDPHARLVAILVSDPQRYTAEQLDAMLRDTRIPTVQDWLVEYILKSNPECEDLRIPWMADIDEDVAAAGWALTSHAVSEGVDNLDLKDLLDRIEEQVLLSSDRLQWSMNECLAMIGIHSPKHRKKALKIGERLGLYKDCPAMRNGTSPYAPAWIKETLAWHKA